MLKPHRKGKKANDAADQPFTEDERATLTEFLTTISGRLERWFDQVAFDGLASQESVGHTIEHIEALISSLESLRDKVSDGSIPSDEVDSGTVSGCDPERE